MSREIGQRLRQAREALGMTLADVSRRTNIEIRYIIAIEKGEWDRLPNIIYARAYVKTYAKLVGERINMTHIPHRGSVSNTNIQTPYTRRSSGYEPSQTQRYHQPIHNTRKMRQIQAEVIDKTDLEEEREETVEADPVRYTRSKSANLSTSNEEESQKDQAVESFPSRREKERARKEKGTTSHSLDVWYYRILMISGIGLIVGFGIFFILKWTSPPGLPLS